MALPIGLGNSTVYAASATSATILVPTGSGSQLRVYNSGAALVWALPVTTATAVVTSNTGMVLPFSVPPEYIAISDSTPYVALITAAATVSVYLTRVVMTS